MSKRASRSASSTLCIAVPITRFLVSVTVISFATRQSKEMGKEEIKKESRQWKDGEKKKKEEKVENKK